MKLTPKDLPIQFSGKLGNMVGSTWKGIFYVRRAPGKRTVPPTQAQLQQQAKFATVKKFLTSMKALVKIGFNNSAIRMTAFNSALSYNLKNALDGIYPTFSINYSKGLLCHGDLPNALAPIATAAKDSIIFKWTDNSGTGDARPTDQAILVLYCEVHNTAAYTTSGGLRSTGAGTLDAQHFKGLSVQTWLAFISEDGNNISDSIFTGELVI